MKIIDVYQCELDKTIPMEYVGKVRYEGENFGISLTDGEVYDIVARDDGELAVVDGSAEDYLYCFSDPRENGKFHIVDDPRGLIKEEMEREIKANPPRHR